MKIQIQKARFIPENVFLVIAPEGASLVEVESELKRMEGDRNRIDVLENEKSEAREQAYCNILSIITEFRDTNLNIVLREKMEDERNYRESKRWRK